MRAHRNESGSYIIDFGDPVNRSPEKKISKHQYFNSNSMSESSMENQNYIKDNKFK